MLSAHRLITFAYGVYPVTRQSALCTPMNVVWQLAAMIDDDNVRGGGGVCGYRDIFPSDTFDQWEWPIN